MMFSKMTCCIKNKMTEVFYPLSLRPFLQDSYQICKAENSKEEGALKEVLLLSLKKMLQTRTVLLIHVSDFKKSVNTCLTLKSTHHLLQ